MRLPFHQYDKSDNEITGDKPFEFSEQELLWASLTVGAPSLSVALKNIRDSPAFAIHKWFAIRSVVEIKDQELRLVPSYKNLDQSEKVVLSYWTGMIFAKLVAEKVLDVPWMAHARLLQKQKRLTVVPRTTKSLPDLVGLDRSKNWHVLEAKGLQRKPTSDQKIHFKQQAERVGTIYGKKPATRNYCITRIRKRLCIELHDPDKVVKDSVAFSIKPHDIQRYYYEPFVAFFGENDENVDERDDDIIYRKVVCDTIDKRKCSIGIVRETLEQAQMQVKSENLVNGIDREELNRLNNERKRPDTFIGSDGIAVKLVPL